MHSCEKSSISRDDVARSNGCTIANSLISFYPSIDAKSPWLSLYFILSASHKVRKKKRKKGRNSVVAAKKKKTIVLSDGKSTWRRKNNYNKEVLTRNYLHKTFTEDGTHAVANHCVDKNNNKAHSEATRIYLCL